MFGLKAKPIIAPNEIAGVKVKPSTRARRMALRVDSRAGQVILTWPRGTSEAMARRFVTENAGWIAAHQTEQKNYFVIGGVITVLGKEYKIVQGQGRGVTHFSQDAIVVYGRAEFLSRRIRDFLKAYAADVFTPLLKEKIASVNRNFKSLRVLDPKTRWGSCTPDGRIMLSWRLLLLPPTVMDYVIAHEVAHCVHMNHGKKFWQLCASLTPNASAARRILKTEGKAVMGY